VASRRQTSLFHPSPGFTDTQVELWRLVAEREKARVDEREALDRGDSDAAEAAAERLSRAKLALEELGALRKEDH